MLNYLARLASRLLASTEADDIAADPLRHPALSRMSERELADLPFTPAGRSAHGCMAWE